MKIVIAPDSFKGSLSAHEVAMAMAKGVIDACPDAQVELCPMADGGEGTVDAMVAATGGRLLSADVFDPIGREIRAHFGMLGHGNSATLPGEVGLAAVSTETGGGVSGVGEVAVIEMAAASGLELVPPDKLDPARATTYGTGQLIAAALDHGAREIIIGIGGSATIDCGFGCMQALGAKFIDESGAPCVQGMGGGALGSVVSIDMSGIDPRLQDVHIRVACDVDNTLTGPKGAAFVYGPQKGANRECVSMLDAGLENVAAVIQKELDVDIKGMRGSGAAGGLGAGLVAMAGAKLENGGKLIAGATGLADKMQGADLCLTGEGRFDVQSASGKVPFRVASIAGGCGVSSVCIAGMTASDAPAKMFREVRTLVSENVSKTKAMACAEQLLADCVREIMMNFTG